MALPKIDAPVFDLTLPLSQKKIRFRPFLVKEQKNLLMALESGEKETIERNVKQVLNNCTLTEKIDIESLPMVDVEYYFLQLRARSVGEEVENKYRCDNVVDEQRCGGIMETKVNLLDIQIDSSEVKNSLIELTDKVSIKLSYPAFSVVEKISNLESASDIAFEMIADSVEYISDGEQIYYAKETPHEEIMEFIESLNQKQFAKIEEFFANLPKLQKKIQMKCPKCGFDHSFDVEGLDSFFG